MAEVRRLRVLEEEKRKLKQLVDDLRLDNQMLQDVLRKSPLKPAQLRPRAECLQAAYGVSEGRACQVLILPRATCPPGSSPYWRNWRIDPQSAHNGGHRKWGKTLPECPATR